MRNVAVLVIFLLTLAVIPAASAACNYPPAVTVPNGGTATKDEMTAARTVVGEYIAQMEAYLDCMDKEEAATRADQLTDEQKSLHIKRHNAAVDAMEKVASDYNEQIRAWKAAND